MKRTVAILLVVLLLFMVGCGGKEVNTSGGGGSSSDTSQSSGGSSHTFKLIDNYKWSAYRRGLNIFDRHQKLLGDIMDALGDPYVYNLNVGGRRTSDGATFYVSVEFEIYKDIPDVVDKVADVIKADGMSPNVEGDYITADAKGIRVTFRLKGERGHSHLNISAPVHGEFDAYQWGYNISEFSAYPWHMEDLFDLYNSVGCYPGILIPYNDRVFVSMWFEGDKVRVDTQCDVSNPSAYNLAYKLADVLGGKVKKVSSNRYIVKGHYKKDFPIVSAELTDKNDGFVVILFQATTSTFDKK